MTIDDYIKWANKEIDKNESYIQAADSLPGLYYDAEEVKGYEKNIEHYKQLVEYLKDCKKGYIHIDDVYRLIAGHSNYHGDSILSALTCIAEGKNVTKPIIPLDKEDCSFEKMPSVTPKKKTVIEVLEKVKEEIKQIRLRNGYIDVQGLTIIKVLEIIDKHLSEVSE